MKIKITLVEQKVLVLATEDTRLEILLILTQKEESCVQWLLTFFSYD